MSKKTNSSSCRASLFRVVGLLLFLALVCESPAALKTWLGTGGTGNWSTSGNWSPAGAPLNGDDLSFPAGAANLANTNNLTDRRFSSIAFSGAGGGYIIRGNAITLTNGLTAAHTVGANTVDITITNGAAQTITATTGGTLAMSGDIVFNGFTLTVNNSVAVNLAGLLSGGGGLTKNGAGNLLLNGAINNTYTGVTTVNNGTLELNDTASATAMVPGDLIINQSGTVLLTEGNQIADTADVTVNGTFNLNGFSEIIATLTMTDGNVATGAGTLTCGNITTLASASSSFISGFLDLGSTTRTFTVANGTAATDLSISAVISGGTSGSPLFIPAGIVKAGPGTLALSGANTYGGATTVNEGILDAQDNLALGGTGVSLFISTATTVNSDAVLLLRNAHVTNEVLVLNSINPSGALQVESTGDWMGPITLNTNVVIEASSLLQLGGAIAGPGGFTKVGVNTLRLIGTNVNSYSGTTRVDAGTLELQVAANNGAIPGDLVIGDGSLTDTVRLLAGDQIANSALVTLDEGGVFDLGTFTDIVGGLEMTGATVQSTTGRVRMSGGLTVHPSTLVSTISGGLELFGSSLHSMNIQDGPAFPELDLPAVISGSGGMSIDGGGNIILGGANTYSGLTVLGAGSSGVIVTHPNGLGSTAGGTVLNGPRLTLSSVTIAGEPLTNNSANAVLQAGNACAWTGPITLNAELELLMINPAYSLDLSGVISGPGGLRLSIDGTATLSGTSGNTFTGPVFVDGGVLQFNKSAGLAIAAGAAALTIGDGLGGADVDIVRALSSNAIHNSVPIIINGSGLLDLNGFIDEVGIPGVTLNGGDIVTGAGLLILDGNLTANASTNAPSISGHLSLSGTRTFDVANASFTVDLTVSANVVGAGGLTKTGAGLMSLSSSNAFTGAVTINDGVLRAGNNFALGTTAGGVAVNGDSVLQLLAIHVGAESLTLNSTSLNELQAFNGSNSWAGTVTLSGTATVAPNTGPDTLNLSGSITGTGALSKVGLGSLYYTGSTANNYAGITEVNSGTLVLTKSLFNSALTNQLVIGDGLGGVNADVVRTELGAQLPNSVAVTINSSGQLILNSDEDFGSLAGSGNLVLNTAASFGAGPGVDNTSTLFSGIISGTGGLTKSGLGTMTLTGNNTYNGNTTVAAGKLVVNGSQPLSPVTVGASGVLGGSGTVGAIVNTAGGVVAPGDSPGRLSCGNVAFAGVSSDVTVELAGLLPGPGYDQLNVTGTNSLGSATLNVTAGFNLSNAPALGQAFTILQNDAGDAITGTFSGRANNSTFVVDNLTFRINYDGGTGNDVTLTLINAGASVIGTQILSGNGNGLVDPNECDLISIVVSNTTGLPMTGISATLASLTPGVAVLQTVSPYPDIPANGRRTNTLPFQLTVSSNFVCGETVDLVLSLETTSHNSFGLPVGLTSGALGATVSFTNSAATAIPDGGNINPVINVAGVTTPLAKVTVELNLTYPQDQDIDVTLEGPDGTIVELTTDNGGTGGNYGGAGCTSSTIFDGTAGPSITAGVAPFIGPFRPEGTIARFVGKSGLEVNGTWILHVTDDQLNGFSGTLNCWKLNLTQATCTPANGPCELCPEITIAGAVGLSDPVLPDRMLRDSIAATCGAPKTCPGVFGGDGQPFVTYAFRNGPSNACVTVALQSPESSDIFSAAYLGTFVPTNICLNYLADGGNSTQFGNLTPSYSFNVPANGVFVVEVNSIFGSTGPFQLTVSGGACRPLLNIAPGGPAQAVLDWTTAAAGYRLERTNNLPTAGGPWQSVPTVPIVVNNRFTVTNNVNNTNQFYRLVKP